MTEVGGNAQDSSGTAEYTLETMKRTALQRAVGSTAEVLVENRVSDDDGDCYVGYTPNYLRVHFPLPRNGPPLENSIVSVGIDAAEPHAGHLSGRAVEPR